MYRFLFLLLFLVAVINVKAQEKQLPTRLIEPYYDLNFTDAERDSLQHSLNEYLDAYREIHKFEVTHATAPALEFNPFPTGFKPDIKQNVIDWGLPKAVKLPVRREEVVFYPVYKLAVLIKNKSITSTELTKLYIARLKQYGDTLQCVISLLEDTALQQAKKADEEIAKGNYRGPLHGIPYGVKDLLAVKGTRTTWGATPYKDQVIDETATVVKKLEDAGAVLVAKLTMGALAMGDIWYGGVTRNPWNLKQGSSGSSAGSASATAAGLVAFSIGTETWGSIVSPSTRCGVTGLRPTYGSVSRYGAMPLSWSMDKIGPICRSALDCALVFNVIRGEDGRDKMVHNTVFNYDARKQVKTLRIGYLKELFDKDTARSATNNKALEVIRAMGITLQPVDLPGDMPVNALSIILTAEGAASFDALTRSDRDSLLTDQRKNAWPTIFRSGRFIPAVEYINALRIRSQLIEAYHEKTKEYDVILAPSFGGNQLLMTNLTGHPCLVVPAGFNSKGAPVSISFLGKLQGESALITLGRAYQEATEWDEQIPPLFK